MPLDKNGDLVFDVDEAQQLHNNAVNMLGKAIGIDVLTTFADVNVADMAGAFFVCYNITKAPNLSNCTNLTNMRASFENCVNLTTIDTSSAICSVAILEDDKFNVVMRGFTTLDMTKPREKWEPGDIFKTGVKEYVYDEESEKLNEV